MIDTPPHSFRKRTSLLEFRKHRLDFDGMTPGFSAQNIFEIYVANGEQAGFWIRRTTWENTCAQVTSIGPLKGPAPYYGNPIVLADVYDLETGKLKDKDVKIPVPGTYKTWRRIDPPNWSRH